jgi:hypothetical protein
MHCGGLYLAGCTGLNEEQIKAAKKKYKIVIDL